MSDRPTPETDDIARGNHVVPTEWAQQLERERDEARDDAAHWKIEYEIVVSRLCGVKHDRDNGVIFEHEIIPKLQRERDEALEVLKRIAHASMSARHKEEDYAEWEKAVESLQGICEEKNFINE